MKECLKKVLASRLPASIVDPSRHPAAVLVPIFQKQGEYHILFIQRSANVLTHRGQIAFPGGVFHQSDGTLLNTAIRESGEEIALCAGDIEVLGKLDDQPSVTSNYVISPFVGFIPYPYPFRVDVRETESIIESPVTALAVEGHFHDEIAVDSGRATTDYYYHCGERIIWGATARILSDFLEVFARAQSVA